MLLDNKTLLFSLMLISGMMALSLTIVTRQNESDGIRRWAGALGLESLVWLLVASRGTIPDFYSIVVANVLMVTAQAMKLAAIHAYRQLEFPRWQCLLPVVVAILLFWLLPYDNARYRLGLGSLLFAAQFLLILRALWNDTESRSGNAWWLLFGATLLMLPLLTLRSIASLSGAIEFVTTPQSSIAPNPVQLAVFVGLTALNLLGAMGFILMVKERGDREIRALAMTDPLTRIMNRRAFMAQAEKQTAVALRHHLPLALLMIDIDHFKRINDAHGHPAGDKVLVSVTELLTAQLRKQDLLARYGGEEFCVLLPSTNEAGAIALADKLRLAVEKTPMLLGDKSVSITISVGVTACDFNTPKFHPDFTSMLQDADRALYLAKEKGRNRTVQLALSYVMQETATS